MFAFLFLTVASSPVAAQAPSNLTTFVNNGTNTAMCNAPSDNALLTINGYAFTIYKSASPSENLTITTYNETTGILIGVVKSQNAFNGTSYGMTFRAAQFNSTHIIFLLTGCFSAGDYKEYGYAYVYLFDGQNLTCVNTGQWWALFTGNPWGGFQQASAYNSNMVNDTSNNFFCATNWAASPSGSNSLDSVNFLRIDGTTFSITLTILQTNTGVSSPAYFGMPTLIYVADSKIWVVCESYIGYYNSLSSTMTAVNNKGMGSLTWGVTLTQMNTEPSEAWWIQYSYDGVSGLLTSCYFGAAMPYNTTHYRIDVTGYYSVSGVSACNTVSNYVAATSLCTESGTISAFRSIFVVINNNAYYEYFVDFNQWANYTYLTGQLLASIEAPTVGAYCQRWAVDWWDSSLNQISGWSINLNQNNSAYGYVLGYFTGTPNTIVATKRIVTPSTIAFPAVNASIGDTALSYYFNGLGTELVLQKQCPTTEASTDALVSVALGIKSTNAALTCYVYLSQNNGSCPAVNNALQYIDTFTIASGFSGIAVWNHNSLDLTNLAGRFIAVGIMPTVVTNATIVIAEPVIANASGVGILYYINTTSLANQITVYSGTYGVASTNAGYYLFYGTYTAPSGNQSGTYGGQTGFNWTSPWIVPPNMTYKNVTTIQVNDSITTYFDGIASSFGIDVLALGMIVTLAVSVATCLGIAYLDKNRRMPSFIYVVTVLFVIAIFTYVSILPTYILLTIFALIIATASIGVASFFSAQRGSSINSGGER